MKEIQDLIETIRFSSDECETFPYLQKYQKRIQDYFHRSDQIENEVLKRYIIVSFWLEHRRAKWQDEELEILRDYKSYEEDSPYFMRRKVYFQFFDEEMKSMGDYLYITGFPIPGLQPDDFLYDFVLNGKSTEEEMLEKFDIEEFETEEVTIKASDIDLSDLNLSDF